MTMKFIRAAALLFALAFAAAPAPASAACAGGTCFAIATGNWGTSGSWSLTSGGVTCACTPGTGDAIVLDANSGAITSTMEAAYSISTFVATGFTGTFVQNAFTLTVTGNTFTLASGMTYNPTAATRLVLFTPASAQTVSVTSATKRFAALTLTGADATSGISLVDALRVDNVGSAGSTLTVTSGTFNANNQNVTFNGFSSTGSTARTLTMGSGTWTITSGPSVLIWTISGSNITITPNTATIAVTMNSTTNVLFTGGSIATYPTLSIGATPSNNTFSIAGANTFAALNITGPARIAFPNGVTTTITAPPTWIGTSSALILVQSDASNAQATLAVGSGNISGSWLLVGDLIATGAIATSSFPYISGHNTGWTITPPTSGGGRCIGC